MDPIDFSVKICSARPYASSSEQAQSVSRHRAFESDRGRIINSAAIRRLQQKTQVFPLERNAAVRSRLTHSLEVQQVGRHIVQTIFDKLSEQEQRDCGLWGLEREVETLVEMGCLMHDVGNPPFGHFGEAAICHWFRDNLDALMPLSEAELCQDSELRQVARDCRQELSSFEGNAQALRMLTSLLQMNLTYSQTACVIKYTRPAHVPVSEVSANKNYLMKKVGYYHTEAPYIEALNRALSIETGCRHPLSYIMEAADDISYCLADIEDAVEKKILNLEQVQTYLNTTFIKLCPHNPELTPGRKFEDFILQASNKSQRVEAISKTSEFFVSLRVGLIHPLVEHAAEQFITHLEQVYHGRFNRALLEDESPAHRVTQTLKEVAFNHVFNHSEVETLELQGERIITGLLDIYRPLLQLNRRDFSTIVNKQAGQSHPKQQRLFNRLSSKHVTAYKIAIARLEGSEPHTELMEFYYRCRLLQDYISGMTDQFALDQYKILTLTN